MGSVSDGPAIIGELREHADAAAFAREVQRVHYRYAQEVVGTFALCPFLKDPQTAFGRFVVVMSRELDVELAATAVLEAEVQVVHLVYPLILATPVAFERFGNSVHQRVASAGKGGPVHAAFHPEMSGDTSTAAKLVGLVRRAPDPFIQFIPEGLHAGGSTFVDMDSVDLTKLLKLMPEATQKNSKSNFERLSEDNISRIQETLIQIRHDRDESYAAFLPRIVGA